MSTGERPSRPPTRTLSGLIPTKIPAAPVAAKIVVAKGEDEGLEIPLTGSIEVGCDPECELVLHDPAVSWRHLTFTQIAGRIILNDRKSRNGTFIGDTRVKDAVVPLGAMISVGNTVLVVQPRWHVREVPPSPARAFGKLLGESVAMREMFAIMERVAPTDLTMLIEGESGTGKEVAARSIHEHSLRAKKPYVVFDCGAVPRELAESELFGHKKGSFSGAIADRQGAFHRADGGTICLDEIGELPLDLQPKLLRVLETSEIRSVGDDTMKKVDVRVIAATNRDLRAEVRRERFRNDLLYRLEVVRINLPALRKRPEDIPMLVRNFLKERIADEDAIEGEPLNKLLNYSWEGNVRELRNSLMRASALAQKPGEGLPKFADLVFNFAGGEVQPAASATSFPGIDGPMLYKEARNSLLLEFERAYVKALLQRNDGNLTQAAQEAGVSRKYLYEIMNRCGESANT